AISLLRVLSRTGSTGRSGAVAAGVVGEPIVPGSLVGVVTSSSLRDDFHMMLSLRQAVAAPASGRPRRASLGAPGPLARAYSTASAAANPFAIRMRISDNFRATPRRRTALCNYHVFRSRTRLAADETNRSSTSPT